MNDRTREKVIEKVQKLLELSRSANENEAALAAIRAREMLDKYNLKMSEVEVREQEVREDQIQAAKRHVPGWLSSLAAIVSDEYNCYCTVTPRRGIISFYGTDNELAVTNYTFTYLRRELERLAKVNHELNKGRMGSVHWKAWRTAYYLGAVHAINVKLAEHKKSRKRQQEYQEATGQSLIVMENQLIEKAKTFAHGLHEIVEDKDKGYEINDYAYSQGFADGGKIPLTEPLKSPQGSQKGIS